MPRRISGFTFPEFLIILAIVSLLLIIFSMRLTKEYIPRAQDAERKTDLERIKVALEDYFNDKSCYPEIEILDNCGSEDMSPYLEKVPCDPETKEPYYYEPDSVDQCGGYRLLAELKYLSDPQIIDMPCYYPYNYGVAFGVPLVPEYCLSWPPLPEEGFDPEAPFVPSGPFYLGQYACDPQGICNSYRNPKAAGCPRSYASVSDCNRGCRLRANYCAE